MSADSTPTLSYYHGQRPWKSCRRCGYDLRGSHSSRCPGCNWPFELPELLKLPEIIQLMKPVRWIGRGALPIACIALALDGLLMPMPIALMVLASLWLMVIVPYWRRARQRWKFIYQDYPHSGVVDPDLKCRRHIARVFLIVGLLIGSGCFQWLTLRISLPWLDSYADHLYAHTPLQSVPATWSWHGLYPMRVHWIEPGSGIQFEVGFGTFRYRPLGTQPYSSRVEMSGYIETPLTDTWLTDKPDWSRLSLWPRLH